MPLLAPVTRNSSPGIRLFRAFGIDVYLHWLWFVIAFIEIGNSNHRYSSLVWNAVEYCGLFVMVLLHEFGHALACKSVGGRAERIMLWPLGGVAYVQPPPRPGALLWSIVAGPLVNVVLVPITIGVYWLIRSGAVPASDDLRHLAFYIAAINILLLIFNLLPIYPLDGGQILRALLWYVIGRANSLRVASLIGLVAAGAALAWTVTHQLWWTSALAVYALLRSWGGMQQAGNVSRLLAFPRHENVKCPACGMSPPRAPLWRCACGAQFDTFATHATCPHCGQKFETTMCLHCGEKFPIDQWAGAETLPPPPTPAFLSPFPSTFAGAPGSSSPRIT